MSAARVRDHQVELAVGRVGLGQQRSAAADEATVADGELDDRAVREQRLAVDRDGELGAGSRDALDAGDQRSSDVADRSEELLERSGGDRGLGADADVCDVDDDVVIAVDDQVDRHVVVGDDDTCRERRIVGQPERRREVVAGAERHESDDHVEPARPCAARRSPRARCHRRRARRRRGGRGARPAPRRARRVSTS